MRWRRLLQRTCHWDSVRRCAHGNRTAPYDLADLGFDPVRIETAEGKQEYAAAQRRFAERGAPLRRRLIAECERLLDQCPAE